MELPDPRKSAHFECFQKRLRLLLCRHVPLENFPADERLQDVQQLHQQLLLPRDFNNHHAINRLDPQVHDLFEYQYNRVDQKYENLL